MIKDNIIPGEVVQHRLQKEWLMVLTGNEIPGSAKLVKCRTKQLEVKEFFSFELEHLGSIDRTGRR